MDPTDERAHLKQAIAKRLFWLREVFDPRRPGNASAGLAALQAWQSQRLEASFTDVLADPAMHAAGRFFLSDLYGDRDVSGRDRDVDRVMPFMVHVLPMSLLGAVRDALELHVLSHAFDLRMTAVIEKQRSRVLDAQSYAKAYRTCGLPRLRKRQIRLIVAVGRSLDAAVHRHGVHGLLRAAKLPARLAGVSDLHGFLERGFHAFAKMEGADRFLSRIAQGESEVSRRLFAGHPEPFGD